jgi:putative sterol carrier protein
MAPTLPDDADEWIAAWQDRLNDNDAYADAAAGWGVDFDGDFLFAIEPDGTYDGEPIYFFVELEDGTCHEAVSVSDPEVVDYGFALEGPYSVWKRLIQGDLDVVEAVMDGDLDAHGSKMRVLQYHEATVEMGETASNVDTEFAY